MTRNIQATALLLGLLSLPQAQAAPERIQPQQLDIFISDQFSLPDLAGYEGWVRNIATVKRLNQYLSQGLPGDPALASSILQVRLTDAIRDEMESGYEHLLRAKHYQIRQVPSVVFDGKYLVEGPGSLNEAFQIYDQYRRTHAQ